jgi:hypothetical protein
MINTSILNMKNLNYIISGAVALMSLGVVSCNADDEYFDEKYQSTAITIEQVYLEDAESDVPDRKVEFARQGQMIRLEGSGFMGMKHVYINVYDTYFNRAYVTDNSMLVTINSKTPITDAEPEDRNIIRLVKDNTEYSYSFVIRAATPTVTSISNTLPKPGETVVVYGTGLQETTSIVLPDGSEITSGIVSDDVDGEWYSFTMPSGVTAGGSLLSTGANGQAKTPAYFNNSDCMILDFDGTGNQGYWSWKETGSMINGDDLADDPLNSGRGKCFQAVPDRLLEAGVSSGKPRATECWTAGNDDEMDDWTRMTKYIDPTTPLTEVAFQFDVYVPEPWSNTGHIQISLINNYNIAGIGSDDDNSSCCTAFYVPWIVDGAIVPFSTTGWTTVTIPLSQMGKYAALIADSESTDPTFQTVIDDRNSASYRNFGMGFVNTDFTYNGVSVVSTAFTGPKIYIDNWRIVPCKSFTISDYPSADDEE